MEKIKENKKIIILITSIILLVFTFFLGAFFLLLSLDRKEKINTKEELIECFNENYELFVVVKDFMEKNNCTARITGDKRRRKEDKNYIIYYEDIENQDIESLFENLDWKLDAIDWKEKNTSIDECTIFTKFGGKAMSNYWGIYYVEDDLPVGWGGEKRFKPIEKQGNGYFIEAYGCRYYTEKICENWWYFETLYD